jgi:hypothetical protein
LRRGVNRSSLLLPTPATCADTQHSSDVGASLLLCHSLPVIQASTSMPRAANAQHVLEIRTSLR